MEDMRFVVFLPIFAAALLAQTVTSVEGLPAVVRELDARQSHEPLPCRVTPIQPALNYGFVFQTGYILRTSLDPYHDRGHHWYIVFRVTPEDGNGPPVLFTDHLDLPAALQPGLVAEAGGSFLLGAGVYDVKWSMLDDLGRVCRQEWTVTAQTGGAQRAMKVTMPPGTAGDYSWRPAPSAGVGSGAKPHQVTILLNAAVPVDPQLRSRAPQSPENSVTNQWGTLLSILGSLLERMPEVSVRLVVFNLDQQRELIREDRFNLDDMNRVAHAADGVERWAVDYHVLQKPSGAWDLLSDLIGKEIRDPVKSEAVIFLGLPQFSALKMPAEMPGPGAGQKPRFFYLVPGVPQAGPGAGVSGGAWVGGGGRNQRMDSMSNGRDLSLGGTPPDPIDQSVRRMKGRTMVVNSLSGFNKAVEEIGRSLNR
jgi:hypothetical protein